MPSTKNDCWPVSLGFLVMLGLACYGMDRRANGSANAVERNELLEHNGLYFGLFLRTTRIEAFHRRTCSNAEVGGDHARTGKGCSYGSVLS